MAETFRARLAAAIDDRGPLCAGIDPSRATLARWGLEDSAAGALAFALGCLDALGDTVAACKPNVAFFEQHGAEGIAALESLLAAARDADVLTIADAKRGDIASTNEAYARAWLGDGTLRADAVTVAPYLGARSLTPFYDAAASAGRGVFVVVRSSNSEGRDVQLCLDAQGRTIEQAMMEEIAAHGGESVGAVVGIMAGGTPLALPDATFYLVPGLWSQGAGMDDLAAQAAGIARAPLVVNLSRSLADAGPDAAQLRAAATRARDEIVQVLRPASG